MPFALSHFWLPKLGNEQADYEDAFAPRITGTLNQQSVPLAVADGAAESSFASDWAKMLARAFVKEPFTTAEALHARTHVLSNRWQSLVRRRPLPWFAEEKTRLGAFATLLGVQVFSSSNDSNASGKWIAIAVGDSCLFQVRDDSLVCAFPLEKSIDFGNSPILISSNLARNSQVWEGVRFQSAEWRVGDSLLLATDALSCWFLNEYERNARPWNILLGFTEDSNPSESFKAWVDKTRASLNMKNDDVTLLILKF